MKNTLSLFIAALLGGIISGIAVFMLLSNQPVSTVDGQNMESSYNGITTIMVPENTETYVARMTTYVQEGGNDPLEDTTFVSKEIDVTEENKYVDIANGAAGFISPSGGPEKAEVSSFELRGNIAYVQLNIDVSGWAGASVSRAIIHPLVEKSLLQFEEISEVRFE